MKEKREALSITSSVSCYYFYFCCFYCPNCQRPVGKKTIRCNHCFYFFGLKTKPTKFHLLLYLWIKFIILKQEHLETEMATHSSTLAWDIPWTEEPGGLQSMGLQRVGHNWASIQSFLRGGNSLRKVETLAKGPRAFDGRARTMAEDSQLPGFLILASLTRCVCRTLESKICPRASAQC